MEIQYIRKLMTSHMVVLGHAEVLSEWEEKMISYTTLGSVLFADYICEDGQCNLWYDITGKLSLDVLLEEKPLDYEMLCRIFVGIHQAVEGLEGILLRGESLLLKPETIFFDYSMQEVYLCYCPGSAESVEESFLGLVEYLLKKLEHTDDRAVEMAYGIYNQAVKSGWTLHELKELVCLSYDAEEEALEAEEEDGHIVRDEPESIRNSEWYKQIVQLTFRVKAFFQKYVMSRLPEKGKEVNEEGTRLAFKPEEEKKEELYPTVLLTDTKRSPEGILRYEGNGSCEDIVIDKQEFLIGNNAACDGWISSATVSRRHAKITRVEEVYFLEDLNSSNGTYVGGQLLNYKTKVCLQKNEIILFADEKFRFI